ncbi:MULTISPECIES: caspase family protein [Catenuloplanes]|uniref:Peptidase C14 caspase domain-containing protein n=1 Tax=Catenuloplanes niger TaxID=587534 RepID=A0AAE3ZJM7_9ACTN|nr:caspase family protein [Catenuloplanes niger]MDR7319880.1 hypothetical protein [Catenuloplanes niger]
MSRPDPDRSVAVLIGTVGHRSPQLPPLGSVTNNLVELARVLSGPPVGLVAPDGITELLDAASQQEVAITLLDRAEEAEDLLLVYFAGHGLLDDNGELYLALHGTDPRPERLSVSALPFALVSRAIRESPARIRVLILDCCFSGVAISAMSNAEIESLVADSTRVEGTYTLTATSGNALALAPPGDDYTAFTGELIRMLREPATGDDLTLTGAYRHLAAVLPGRGWPRPQQRTTNGAGDLVLRPADSTAPPHTVEPRAAATAVLPTPVEPPRVLRRPRNPLHPLHFRRYAPDWWSLAAPVLGALIVWTVVSVAGNAYVGGDAYVAVYLAAVPALLLIFLVVGAIGMVSDSGLTWTRRAILLIAIAGLIVSCNPRVKNGSVLGLWSVREPDDAFLPGYPLLLILLVVAARAAGRLVVRYAAEVLRRYEIRLDRNGFRVVDGRDEYYLLWQQLERVWVSQDHLCVSFKPGYSEIRTPEEINYSSRYGGYVIADLRVFTTPRDQTDLALAHFAGPAFRRGPDRAPGPT